jgi:hypothetical protein
VNLVEICKIAWKLYQLFDRRIGESCSIYTHYSMVISNHINLVDMDVSHDTEGSVNMDMTKHQHKANDGDWATPSV